MIREKQYPSGWAALFVGHDVDDNTIVGGRVRDAEYHIARTGVLSPKQVSFLLLRSLGLSSAEIGQELNLSKPAIKSRAHFTYGRLSVGTAAEAVVCAFREGVFVIEKPLALPSELTDIEQEILGYTADGNDYSEIAQLRGRSLRTIEAQMAQLRMNKFALAPNVASAVTAGFLSGQLALNDSVDLVRSVS